MMILIAFESVLMGRSLFDDAASAAVVI